MRTVPSLRFSVLAAALFVTACGGGGGGGGSTSAPLGAANRDAAAGDALSLSLDSSLAMSLSGYYVPAATVASEPVAPRFSLRLLGDLLLRQAAAQAQKGGAAAPMAAMAPDSPAGIVTAPTTTVETVACDGGGSYTLTSTEGSATWSYSACVDAAGNTLNGQIASTQLDSVTYQGDFTHFTMGLPDEAPVQVHGRLRYSSDATVTELQAPQLSVSLSVYSLTLSDYLWRATDIGTETVIETHGQAATTGAAAYSIAFDNSAEDADQGPFYVADGDAYPYTGSLEIQDAWSANRIVLSAMNSLQAMLEFTVNGQASSAWTLWGDLL